MPGECDHAVLRGHPDCGRVQAWFGGKLIFDISPQICVGFHYCPLRRGCTKPAKGRLADVLLKSSEKWHTCVI